MASAFFNGGITALLGGGDNSLFLVDTMKIMLTVTATPYTFDDADDFIDESGANDPIDAEASITGYTGGFGGAGRKTLASKTITASDANNRAELDAADLTWTGLGAGETLEAGIMVEEITNDAASRLLIYLDPSNIATNGSDVAMAFAAAGLGVVNTV